MLLARALDRDGAPVHVRELDRAARRARAPFRCAGCGEEVVARLGAIRARHFAHRPGSACPLTRPETALHLGAKERLLSLCAEAFSGRRSVTLRARCPACRREAPLELAALGDAAEPEGALGALRCDVLVTRGGVPALALEVLVTHAVEPDKEAALARLGVPALEIDAREAWEEEGPSWSALRVARTLGMGACARCQAAERAERERGAGGEAGDIAELEAYRARGLLGSRPGPPLERPEPLSAGDLRAIAAGFRCPECGGMELEAGERLVRHPCPEGTRRPVAWRGYDGARVELGWWRPSRPR